MKQLRERAQKQSLYQQQVNCKSFILNAREFFGPSSRSSFTTKHFTWIHDKIKTWTLAWNHKGVGFDPVVQCSRVLDHSIDIQVSRWLISKYYTLKY